MKQRLSHTTTILSKVLLLLFFSIFLIASAYNLIFNPTISSAIIIPLIFLLSCFILYLNFNEYILEYDDSNLYYRRILNKKAKQIPFQDLRRIKQVFTLPTHDGFYLVRRYKIEYMDNLKIDNILFDYSASWKKGNPLNKFITLVKSKNHEFEEVS